MTLFYYMDNETRQSVGPVSMSTLVKMKKSGILDEDTLVKSEENPKWMKFSGFVSHTNRPDPITVPISNVQSISHPETRREPDGVHFFYRLDTSGKEYGPYSSDILMSKFKNKEVAIFAELRKVGTTEWYDFGQITPEGSLIVESTGSDTYYFTDDTNTERGPGSLEQIQSLVRWGYIHEGSPIRKVQRPPTRDPTHDQARLVQLVEVLGGVFVVVFLLVSWFSDIELPFGKKYFRVECISTDNGSINHWDFKDLDRARHKRVTMDEKGHSLCSTTELN